LEEDIDVFDFEISDEDMGRTRPITVTDPLTLA
jgi:hypothetical protein